jgi:rod shape-determining protein MreC
MHRLLEFIKLIYVLVLFVVLEGFALWTYATSSPYTEAKILSRTTAMGAAVSGAVTNVENFFALSEANRQLTERIAELNEEILGLKEGCVDTLYRGDELVEKDSKFRYHYASVVSMTTNRKHNNLILDRGTLDGISKDMGVITPENELVGYVVSCSDHYCVVQPMLNIDFSTGGRLEDGGLCVIWWSGASKYEVEAKEISVYSEPNVGMSVEVRSERLPEGVLIGTVTEYELNSTKSAYSAKIAIAANMSKLDDLLIVENTHYGEIEELMNHTQE